MERLGEIAVGPLLSMLRDERESPTRKEQAAAALGAIGDRQAIAALAVARAHRDKVVGRAARSALMRIDPSWLHSAEARLAVPDLVAALAGHSKEGNRNAASILSQVDPRWPETEAALNAVPGMVLKLLFSNPDHRLLALIESVLRALVPVSALTEEVVTLALDASGFEHQYSGAREDEGWISLQKSAAAVRSLCFREGAVSSNLLHLVAHKRDTYEIMSSLYGDSEERVSFEDQRLLAREELARRGNPGYTPDAYLKAG